MRLDPHALGVARRAPARGSVLVSATNGKTTTAAMAAAHPRARRRAARAQPRRREHGRRDRHGAADGGAAAWRDRRRARAVRGGRAVAGRGRGRAASRARCCSATCSATSSTATASSRRSPSAGRRDCNAEQLVLNADDPLIADLGRERPRALYFGRRGRLARAARDGARRRRQALPPLRRAVCVRRRLPRPPRPLPLPELRPDEARAGGHGARGGARRRARGALHAATPAGEARVTLGLPGLYNVYNALAAAALATALEVPLASIVPGSRARGPRSGAPRP